MPWSRHQSMVKACGDQPMPLIAYALPPRRVDQGRHFAAQAAIVGLQQVEAEAHRRGRVDRVAALFHDAEAGGRRQVVTRGDDAARAQDDRTHCGL